ncbi:MAG: sensor histidine kinase [Calditrichaeota bacterium]|nr:MAG: sensor histidine kinase [Calditrichota bacterium]
MKSRILGFVKAQSLRMKLVLPVSLILISTIIGFSLYTNKKQSDSFHREMESTGETIIRMLSSTAELGVVLESPYELENALKILEPFENVQYVEITNSDEQVLITYGEWDSTNVQFQDKIEGDDLQSKKHCKDYYIQNELGQNFILMTYPVFYKEEILDRETLGLTGGVNDNDNTNFNIEEIGEVKLILSLENLQKAISTDRNAAIFLTIIVTIFALIILSFLVNFIIEPIKKMVDVTTQISKGDLEQKLNIDRQDEIGQLALTFDQMVESLKASRDEIEDYNKTLEEKIVERTVELEEAQSQLVQSEKLGAIGQLAAGVAHELNNPLGGILGYAQFTLEKLKKNVPENTTAKEMNSYVKYLTDIEKQARRCKNIVQNLLRFSRSSKTTELSGINLNSIIDDTCTFVEHQLHMNQILLKVNLDDKLPEIQANAGQLQQVFTNLIINAMHASPPDSEIQVITRFSPPLGEFDGTVEVQIIDQGKGIPKENLKKIFEPFFTTKEVGKGTGLGLSVSYGILKEHGAEVKVDSKVDKGTCFTITFPLQKSYKTTDTNTEEYIDKFNKS